MNTVISNNCRHIRTTLAVGVLVGFAVSFVGAPAAMAATPSAAHSQTHSSAPSSPAARQVVGRRTRQIRVGATSDSYVSYRHPHLRPGHSRELVAANTGHDRRVVYVKFRVGGMPQHTQIKHTMLQFTRATAHSPAATLSLYRVRSTHWSQHRLDASNRPRGVHHLATRRVGAHTRLVGFPFHMPLRPHHTYSFAVTSSARHAATRFKSRESGLGPKMALRLRVPILLRRRPPIHPPPTPTPTPTPSTTPSSTPTPTPSETPSGTPTPTPSETPSGTPTPTPSETPSGTPTPTPTPSETPSGTPTPTPTPSDTPPPNCSLSSTLVPSCGTLLGGYLTSFGGSTVSSAFSNFNSQSGSTISVSHDYRRPGDVLSPGDIAVAKTPGALLLLNWKPANVWADAGGGNANVNAQIDAMANSIKSLGSTKILLTVFHEPENDVSGGAANCPSSIYKGTSGTPADYRAMWANVEARFAALNVTNVVWSMNYMGFTGWDCMMDDLWPGNNLVDWVLYDPYASDNLTYSQTIGAFYRDMTNRSNAAHDYLSKPWGIGEFGDRSTSAANQENFWSTVAASLDANQFPKLKLLTFFDAIGTTGDYRVAYGPGGSWDSKEVSDLQVLSQDPSIVAGRASVAGG